MQVRKLFVRLFLLLLPFIIALCYIESRLAHVPNSYNKKRTFLEQQADSIEVLITGSSHTAYGIDPAYMSRHGFDLGHTSQTLFYDDQEITRYFRKLKNLKLVIIPLSYFSFYLRTTDADEAWRDPYYKHFWGFCYKPHSLKPPYYSYIAMYGSNETIINLRYNFKKDLSENLSRYGFLKYDTVGNSDLIGYSKGLERVRKHEQGYKPERTTENRGYLEHMISELQSAGIKVVLITTPLLRYKVPFENPKYQEIMYCNVHEICQKYNLQYFDYSHDPRFTQKDFRDNDHMNFMGARHFTPILDSEVIRKVLSQ